MGSSTSLPAWVYRKHSKSEWLENPRLDSLRGAWALEWTLENLEGESNGSLLIATKCWGKVWTTLLVDTNFSLLNRWESICRIGLTGERFRCFLFAKNESTLTFSEDYPRSVESLKLNRFQSEDLGRCAEDFSEDFRRRWSNDFPLFSKGVRPRRKKAEDKIAFLITLTMFLAYGDNYFPTWRHSTNYEWAVGRGWPIFGAKLKRFHFWKSDIVFRIMNLFSWIFNVVSSQKSCPTSMPFLLTYIWRQNRTVFPACRTLIGQFKFQAHRPYARLD